MSSVRRREVGDVAGGPVVSGACGVLRSLKYWASGCVSPQLYWYLMGRMRPVPAVTSYHSSLADCLDSGEGMVALLERFHPLGPEMVTLHIGSGLGRVEYHLRRRVRACYGIDISSSMVKRARALVPDDNVEFVHGDGSGLSGWPDGFFDLIYSFFVFQHMPRPQFQDYMRDAHAKLRVGGSLIFQILVDEQESFPDPPLSHPYGIRYYRRCDVEIALRQTGFEDVTATGLDDAPVPATGDMVFCARKVGSTIPSSGEEK